MLPDTKNDLVKVVRKEMRFKTLRRFENELFGSYIIFHYWLYRNKLKSKIEEILQYDEDDVELSPNEQQERALPGFGHYEKTGYFKYMLARYLYSIKYAKNKRVLDSGCGLGWGSFLISDYPKSVLAIDIDKKAIEFARTHWFAPRLAFKRHSFLELDLLNKTFEVILGIEVIEHLTISRGERYLTQCFKNLDNAGVLILSSSFPDSIEDARNLERNNRFHAHIYTKEEIVSLSKVGFTNCKFLGNFIVVLRK